MKWQKNTIIWKQTKFFMELLTLKIPGFNPPPPTRNWWDQKLVQDHEIEPYLWVMYRTLRTCSLPCSVGLIIKSPQVETKQSLKCYTLWWKLSISESVAIPRVATTSDTTIICSSANIRRHYQPSQTHNSLGNMNDVVRVGVKVAVHHRTEGLDLLTHCQGLVITLILTITRLSLRCGTRHKVKERRNQQYIALWHS